MRVLYFARNKADKRHPNEQCQAMAEYQRKRGFDTWVIQAQTNYLVLYGKDNDET